MNDVGKVNNDFVLEADYNKKMDNLKGREVNLKLSGYEAWILLVNLYVGLQRWDEREHSVVNVGQRIYDDLLKTLSIDESMQEALNRLGELLDKRR